MEMFNALKAGVSSETQRGKREEENHVNRLRWQVLNIYIVGTNKPSD